MHRPIFIIVILLLLAACGPVASFPTPQPTIPPLVGTVEIGFPQDGSVIYAETLPISGTAEGVPANQFTLKLIGPDDKTIARAEAHVDDNGNWQLELVHGYTGEPIEVTILALPDYTDAPANRDYSAKSIVLAAQSYRPDGTFGSITAPMEGASVGGDQIPVSGTVSGVFENQFTVALIAGDGRVIDSRSVLADNPNFIDEVPWTAELSTQGYTGPAEIHAFANSAKDGSEILLGSAKITITQTAG